MVNHLKKKRLKKKGDMKTFLVLYNWLSDKHLQRSIVYMMQTIAQISGTLDFRSHIDLIHEIKGERGSLLIC